MPKPTQSELKNNKKSEYISRCISYLVKNEGKSTKQAAGQCYGMWENHKKKKENKADFSEPKWEDEILPKKDIEVEIKKKT